MLILMLVCVTIIVILLVLLLLLRNSRGICGYKDIICGGSLLVIFLIFLYFLTFKAPEIENKNTHTYDAIFVETRFEKNLLGDKYIVVFEIDNKFYETNNQSAYYYFKTNDVETIKVNLTEYNILGIESNYITKIYYNEEE